MRRILRACGGAGVDRPPPRQTRPMPERLRRDDDDSAPWRPPERPAPPAAAQPPHVAQLLAAQSGAGNAMVSRALVKQRAPAQQVQGNWITDILNQAKKNAGMPYVADHRRREGAGHGHQAGGRGRAASSRRSRPSTASRSPPSKGVEAVKAHYDRAPEDVRKKVKGATWKFEELQALERALAHFAPILGTQRLLSDRAGEEQEDHLGVEGRPVDHQEQGHGRARRRHARRVLPRVEELRALHAGRDGGPRLPGRRRQAARGDDRARDRARAHEVRRGRLHEGDRLLDRPHHQERHRRRRGAADRPTATRTPPRTSPSRRCSSSSSPTGSRTATALRPPAVPGNACPKRFAFLERIVGEWKPPVGDFPTPDPNADTALA